MQSDIQDILVDDAPVEKVNEFKFLGSVLPGSNADIKRRINLASSAFGRLKKNI